MKSKLFLLLRSVIAVMSVIMSLFFVVPMSGGIKNIGNISGALLCVWIFCVSVKPLHSKIKNLFMKKRFTKYIYRFVNFCFIAFSIYGVLVTGAMLVCAMDAPAENATAVVLGAQVKKSGPSVMLWGRINAANEYLEESSGSSAVLSGGQGDDEPISEAQSMYDKLTGYGIIDDRLYKEDKSTNTTENIKYSMEIIEENRLNSDIAVVTDGFHQLRVRIIAAQLGIEGDVGAVNSDTSLMYLPTFAVREWFALPYRILFR